jgi:hypothetical protein
MARRCLLAWGVVLFVFATLAGSDATVHAQLGSNVICVASAQPDATCNVIGGSGANQIAQNIAGGTISGGGERDLPNRITGDYGTIGGGSGNQAGERAVVAGGSDNTASGFRALVGGGHNNTARGAYSTISGGENNSASYYYATIGGGGGNESDGRYATVGGGSGNLANFTHATIAGGSYNTASSINSTVGGGDNNVASGAFSTVAGGSGNHAAGFDTIVAGGSGNSASGDSATVGGGLTNRAYANYSTVAGGNDNVAGAPNVDSNGARYATVGGGAHNRATGAFSIIPGGASNRADSAYSFAAGRRAVVKANDPGAMLFADSSDFDFTSSAANEFAVRATGGVRLVTAIDTAGAPASGVWLAPGSGAWSSLSDRASKSNIAPVNPRAVLAQLMRVPISTWNYKTQDASVRHIGPMAQDFRVFGVGEDAQHISTVDANGVALAAIQGLAQIQEEQAQQLAELKSENAALEARLAALEQNARGGNGLAESSFPGSINLLLFIGVCLIGWTLGRTRGKSG